MILGKNDKRKPKTVYGWIFILLMSSVFTACAFGRQGQANTGYFGVEVPEITPGMSKAQTVDILGIPDSTVSFEEKEYWRYRNISGWYILLVGATEEKDLVIEFKEDKVTKSYQTNKGSSFGIFMLQGAVAN